MEKTWVKHRKFFVDSWNERRKTMIVPKKDTSIEVKIQNQLRELGYDFFTHQYRNEIEHSYQCDIFVPSLNVVIECDGNYWHNYPVRNDIDNIRTEELLAKGFKVLRLWELEIKQMSTSDLKIKLQNC
jgi:very-short-patch-repair endonuclease